MARHAESRVTETIPALAEDDLEGAARRLLADAVRQSDERFRTLVETIPAAVFLYGDNRTTYVNSAAERISGYNRDELLQLEDFWRLVHPESRPLLMEMYEAHMRGETIPTEYEVRILTKGGESRWVQFTFDWVTVGPERGVLLGTAFDISQRKEAENALRASEERYKALYRDNPSMYFTVAEDGTILSVNEFGASQLGYRVEELQGKSVFMVFHRQDRRAVKEHVGRCLADPGTVSTWQFRKVRKDGSVIWVEERALATRDAGGGPVVLVVCEDITARKEMEDALVALREELDRTAERVSREGAPYGLTFRELTVLQLLAAGASDKEIGATLGISSLTANKHVGNILRKMKVRSRTSASVLAVRAGLAR